MATNNDMREQLKSLETKFDGLEKKVDQLPTAADFTRLTDKVAILIEDAKTAVKNAADGFKGTLERIERDLGDLNKKVDVKFSDHDEVLANHNKRITVLEAPGRPSSGGV